MNERATTDQPPAPGTEVRIVEALNLVGCGDKPWTGIVANTQDQPGRLRVRVTQYDPPHRMGELIYAEAWELASEPPSLRLPDGWERTDCGHLECKVGFRGHRIIVTPAGRIGIDIPGSTAGNAARNIATRISQAADIADQLRAGVR